MEHGYNRRWRTPSGKPAGRASSSGPYSSATVLMIAAPVGVVNSNGTCDAASGTPFRISAVAGAGRVVDLVGEPGIGKSRLVEELLASAALPAYVAGCDQYEMETAYWPMRALLRSVLGVAPDAGIVSVKVGDNTGGADITQVIAGVDWAIDHAAEYGIRVINLSYASGSLLGYDVDPLAYTLERAWKAGIVVVVAAGNDGGAVGSPANCRGAVAVGDEDVPVGRHGDLGRTVKLTRARSDDTALADRQQHLAVDGRDRVADV